MSHVPRVYAFGHGNTSSRTPLIILVVGEFGTSGTSVFFLGCASNGQNLPNATEAIVPMNERWRKLNANMHQYVPLRASMGQHGSLSAAQRKTAFGGTVIMGLN